MAFPKIDVVNKCLCMVNGQLSHHAATSSWPSWWMILSMYSHSCWCLTSSGSAGRYSYSRCVITQCCMRVSSIRPPLWPLCFTFSTIKLFKSKEPPAIDRAKELDELAEMHRQMVIDHEVNFQVLKSQAILMEKVLARMSLSHGECTRCYDLNTST